MAQQLLLRVTWPGSDVLLPDDSRRRAWIVHQWAAVLDASLASGA